jgi:Kelch motif
MNDKAIEAEFERRLRAWYRRETDAVLPAPAELRDLVVAIPQSTIKTAGRPSKRRMLTLVAAALLATSVGGMLITGGIATPTPTPTPVPPSLPAVVPTDLAWRSVPSMSVGRIGHTATLLPDGRVLVVGGYSASAEVWDPLTRAFTMTGSMAHVRTDHAAALISDGRVLVVGGNSGGNSTGDFTREVEAWDPKTGAFSVVGSLPARRGSDVSATRVLDGRILIAGGLDCPSILAEPTGDPCAGVDRRITVLFDPATDSLSPGPRLNDDRVAGTAVALVDGRVFFIGTGGYREPGIAEVLDPVSGRVESVGTTTARLAGDVRATLLDDGRVLVTALWGEPRYKGGAELWDPTTGQFTRTESSAGSPGGYEAVGLHDGRVLVVGVDPATDNTIRAPTTALWDQKSERWSPGPAMGQARVAFTLTVLVDGAVLALGGVDALYEDTPDPIDSAELLAPSAAN